MSQVSSHNELLGRTFVLVLHKIGMTMKSDTADGPERGPAADVRDLSLEELRSIAGAERFRTLCGRGWSQTAPSLVVVARYPGALDQ